MMKKYAYIILLLLGFTFTVSGYSQTNGSSSSKTEGIEDLNIYPNPVSNGKITITTKQNLTKDIEIFDVLGKKVHSSSLFGNELNISKLTPGIYILKIKENTATATRKLVVK